MKIVPEHFNHMLNAIRPFANQIADYREQLKLEGKYKDLEKRIRWDASAAAKLTSFYCSTVYLYANDEHIDTALRKIMQIIEKES